MSRVVTINDKKFMPMIGEKKIEATIDKLAERINAEHATDHPLFVAVLNGSFIFAADLLRKIRIPCEISFVKLSSYQGLNSTGKVKEMIGLDADVNDRTVVIIEDIVDSGLTVEAISDELHAKNARSVKVATFLFKPSAFKWHKIPDYIGFEIGEEFVVGYGMDYCGYGRNLSEVHVLESQHG